MSEKRIGSSYGKLMMNTIVFAIGSFSSKVLVLLLVPIYTKHLTQSELGRTDYLTQIANWIIPLATMTISEAIIRFGLDKAYDKKKVFTIGNVVCGAGMLIFAALLGLISLIGVADKWISGYAVLLFLYVFMSGIKTLYTTFVRAMEKVQLFALAGIVATFFTLFFMVLFYLVLPEDFLGANTGIQKYLLSTILSDAITAVFVTIAAKLWKYIDFKFIDRELLQTMLQYSVPLIPAQLLWLITNSSDSFMTTYYIGEDRNGVLSAAYKIPNLVATVYMMFGQAWNMSAITENDSEDRDKFYEKVFDFNQSLLYILAAGCLLIVQPITMVWIDSKFRECVRYSPLLIYSTIFSCLTTFMGSIYLASKLTKRSLFTSLISGVINVGLNIVLIPTIGLYGPPLSTIASYMTVFIIRAIDSKKIVPFKMDIRKMIVSNVLVMMMTAVLVKEPDLMHHRLLYLVVLALFCAVFVINMESISSLFFRFMPKRIAEKVTNLGTKKLSLIAAGVVAFAGLNLLFKCVPLILVLAAGYAFGIKLDAPKIFLFCQVLCSALIWLLFSHIFGAGVLFIMCAAPIVMYRKKRYIAMAVASFDLLLGALILSDLGWFLFLIQLIALIIVYRKSIDEFALDYIEFGTLGPLDRITGMIPVRRRGRNAVKTSELPESNEADSQ
ncbi:lipopolysaccharide biosynthesis protein [Ruminococcus albus]|uniref:Membrane protein involved in the export of O-antigen and teichoic acid n=1 Tax=Ruminococcus albus TaxID=1264 RepID=A0A1I1ES81_RUMAL|nr:polysaccharide biosynthesis C-terminal domain-containing protein [Ruminococcus albus]SFB89857.1 Membrane protein involved in the export of O-antigen and teichoic acid [Ruminococcus albus]